MNKTNRFVGRAVMAGAALLAVNLPAVDTMPNIPRFSVAYMDTSVDPSVDFYHYACGNWLKNNPVPADKARWAGFDELQQRNWFLIRGILEAAAPEDSAKQPIQREPYWFGNRFVNLNKRAAKN